MDNLNIAQQQARCAAQQITAPEVRDGSKREAACFGLCQLTPAADIAPQMLTPLGAKSGCEQVQQDALFDHLVGASRKAGRHFKPKGLGGLEVNHELELSWMLDRKLARLLALQDAIDIAGGKPE